VTQFKIWKKGLRSINHLRNYSPTVSVLQSIHGFNLRSWRSA